MNWVPFIPVTNVKKPPKNSIRTRYGKSDTAPIHKGNFGTLRGTEILTYPENVGEDPHQAHYIMFSIRKFIKGKIAPPEPIGGMAKMNKALEEYGDLMGEEWTQEGEAKFRAEYIKRVGMNKQRYFTNEKTGERTKVPGPGSTKNTSLTLTQRPLSTVIKNIALYMPASATVKYAMQYGDQEISQLADMGMDLMNYFTGKASGGELFDMLKKKGAVAANRMGVGMLDTVAPGIKALEAIHEGRIITPRMELMFEGLGRRDFSYSFTFIPKSRKESEIVDNIVKTFKTHMHPPMTDTAREFGLPDVFDIDYMSVGGRNTYLNKISTCYCTSMDVTYGGDRYTTYSPKGVKGSPPPQQTKIDLSFKEIELIDRKRVEDGY